MANRTRARDFERRLSRINAAAQGAENARSAATRLSRESVSTSASPVTSLTGAA
ncbi:hypothetical protein [Streptomyces violascens]|uniref:hypothetical protein n=1 Tax=Streptomyces violascens TaxID=67381 RepID=UPI001672B0FD|nr:hypothetical protein [Streptomyces violascens]GGU49679.1 hypothetical protein GCM10010289_82780 [Streptomyces violascens]